MLSDLLFVPHYHNIAYHYGNGPFLRERKGMLQGIHSEFRYFEQSIPKPVQSHTVSVPESCMIFFEAYV